MKKQENLLEKRLQSYTQNIEQQHSSKVSNTALLLTASAAAGMGALICPPPSEAAVQYSGHKSISVGSSVSPQYHEIDLDGDGIPDFAIDFAHYLYNVTFGSMRQEMESHLFFFEAAAGNSFLVPASSTHATALPARLPGNYTIQSAIPVSAPNQWSSASGYGLLGAKGHFYRAHYSKTAGTMIVDINISGEDGEFIGEKGYIGVRFKISGQTHYGWIQFASDENVKNGMILDWAYEDQADKPIRAGQGRFIWSLFMPIILNSINQTP